MITQSKVERHERLLDICKSIVADPHSVDADTVAAFKSSVRAFLAQRLVRRLCPQCCQPAPLTQYLPSYLESIGFPLERKQDILNPVGCRECRGTGYRGRMAIIEVCTISGDLQELITERASASALRAKAAEGGMISMRDYGWRKVIAGETTIDEVIAATAAEASN